MNITRFEPWNLINVLHRDLDTAAAVRAQRAGSSGTTASAVDWIPDVDIVEEKARYVMRADVPGVNAENIDIRMEKDILTLEGQRTPLEVDDEETLQLRERTSGAFRRRFTLPESADADEISATYANGILEVIIPKQAEVKARRITVKAA